MPPQATEDAKLTARRSGPKSRLGCKTCKLRHVKCDETKPKCLRCLRSGWHCDGYPPLKHFQQERSVSAAPRPLLPLIPLKGSPNILSTDSVSQTFHKQSSNENSELSEGRCNGLWNLVLSPFSSFPGSSKERRSLDFFLSRSMPDIGVFLDSTLLNDVSCPLVHAEKSIQHAITAVAAAHEDCLRKLDSREAINQTFAITQYNKAINNLNLRLQGDRFSHQITLLTCILFMSLEVLRGDLNNVYMHGRSGELLLASYHRRFPPTSKQSTLSIMIDENVKRIFAHFRMSSFIACPISGALDYQHLDEIPYRHHETAFLSIKSAKERLDNLIDQSFKPYHGPVKDSETVVTEEQKTQRLLLVAHIRRWTFRVDEFATNFSLSVEEMKSVRFLKIHSIMAMIWNLVSIEDSQSAFDDLTKHFDSIMTLVESIINSEPSQLSQPELEPDPGPRPLYSFEPGLTYPLLLTGLRCRSPSIRRRALSLLQHLSTLPQGETWTTILLSLVVQRAIEFEESHCAVPPTEDKATWTEESKRIHGVFFLPVYGVGREQVVLWMWRPKWTKEKKKEEGRVVEHWVERFKVQALAERSLRKRGESPLVDEKELSRETDLS